MGILKSAADLVYTIRFLKLLVTPFDETDAFKAGIIDEDGNKNKDFSLNSMDDRGHIVLTILHFIVLFSI